MKNSPSPNDAQDKYGIVYDQDKYAFETDSQEPLNDAEMTRVLGSLIGEPIVFQLWMTYYFQIRNSYIPCGVTASTMAKAQSDYKELRQQLMFDAARLTALHLRSGHPLVPRWIEAVQLEVVPMCAPVFPQASSVHIEIDQVPRLQCRAIKDNRVRVSALTRDVYFQLNLFLWNALSEGPLESETQRFFLRMALPYFIQMNDYVPVSRLPTAFGQTETEVFAAHQTTHLQMMFLFAHEYGHLFHGHEKMKSSPEQRLSREYEADLFALRQIGAGIAADRFEEFLAAFRWLFYFQRMDNFIGAKLRGHSVPYDDLDFNKRFGNIIPSMMDESHGRLTFSGNIFREMAVGFLIEVLGRIDSLGTDKLRAISDDLSHEVHERRPWSWWEELK